MPKSNSDDPCDGDVWISANEAYEMVRERNGSADAEFSIARRAAAGLIRTWAALSTREQLTTRGKIETVSEANAELSKEFWWAEGEAALEQDWVVGDFRTWIYDKFPRSGEHEWRAFGVKFELAGIHAMLALPLPRPIEPGSIEDGDDVSVPRQPMPPDEEIRAKMIELTGSGVNRDTAAKIIRQFPGFETVGNEDARRAASTTLAEIRNV